MTKTLKNQNGFVLIVSLLMLVVLMIIGIAATNTTNLELMISGNDRLTKVAFYSAEAGLSFAYALPGGYGSANTTVDWGYSFPQTLPIELPTNPPTETPDPPASAHSLGNNNIQSFQGTIIYRGAGALPPGSGYSEGVGEGAGFNAHFYDTQSTGFGPVNSTATVETRGYRIGF